MDIDQLMYQAVSRDNDSNELKGFIQSQGPRESANEHLVPAVGLAVAITIYGDSLASTASKACNKIACRDI